MYFYIVGQFMYRSTIYNVYNVFKNVNRIFRHDCILHSGKMFDYQSFKTFFIDYMEYTWTVYSKMCMFMCMFHIHNVYISFV